jgi:hypothetical protein
LAGLALTVGLPLLLVYVLFVLAHVLYLAQSLESKGRSSKLDSTTINSPDTDLSAMTDKELDMWFVYADLVNDTAMYVGSATADPNKTSSVGGGFTIALTA